MRSVGGSGRGVRTGLLGVRSRGRTGAIAAVTAGLLLLGPTASASPTVAPVPDHYASVLGAGGGSDRISALIRQIRETQARIASAEVRLDTLDLEREQIATELAEAKQRRASLKERVATGRSDLAAAERDERAAKSTYRKAKRAKKSATRELATAQRSLEEAQLSLDSAAEAADRAAASVRRAEKRVTKARRGTKVRRSAFRSWQMAAIEDRAAHARQDLAGDLATDQYVGLQAAEAAMTTATYDKQVAAAARRAAIAGTALAQEQLDDLVERRARARATVKALRAEDADVAEERGEVTASVKKLEARLATIQKRVAEVERSLAGVEAPPKKKREEEAS